MPVDTRDSGFGLRAALALLLGLAGVTVQATDRDILMKAPPPAAKTPAPPMDAMAERLRLRLERQPDDMQGWVLLGKSYDFLGQDEKANAAFERARALGYTGEATANTAAPSGGGASVNPVIMQDIRSTIYGAGTGDRAPADAKAAAPQGAAD
jgi:hypothetical protein